MKLLAPWWVYTLLFIYSGTLHYIMKMKRYPELSNNRIYFQSLIVGAIIMGFALLTWRVP